MQNVNAPAIWLMICGAALIPLGDAMAKFASQTYGVEITFMAWSRFAIAAVLLAPFALSLGVRPAHIVTPAVIARGVTIAATVWLILQAALRIPIASVYGAFFIAPVLSFALAVLFLKERPGRSRTILICIGLLGVILVVRPGIDMSSGLLFALGSGVFYAIFLTANRWMSGRHAPLAMLWGQLVVGAFVLAPFGFDPGQVVWQAGVLVAIFGSAITSMSGNLLILLAYKRAEATRLAPLVYTQLIAATLYGMLFFGAIPDGWTLAGLALLIASGFAALSIGRGQARRRPA